MLSQFEAEQDDYYNQLGRQRKERGLDQYRTFNTVNSFAPNYAGDTSRIVVPERPDIMAILGNTTGEGLGNASSGDGESKGSKIFTQLDNAENKVRRWIDPIGAKISRKDPVRKALKKLF